MGGGNHNASAFWRRRRRKNGRCLSEEIVTRKGRGKEREGENSPEETGGKHRL